MTHQQASAVALIKRIAGIIIFVPAFVSTIISVLKYLVVPKANMQEMTATIMDFLQVIIKIVRQYTSFLEYFWANSPIPDILHWSASSSLWFIVIFMLMFIGLALQASGARLAKRVYNVKEGIRERAILEAMNGDEARSFAELEKLISIPNTSIFAQYGLLYISPVFWGIFIYIILYLINRL
ncbi:YniB family protein [Jinshanibacter sp. LJY008]|uniref:YniB family protein n=1 Tax=Limnobaculum eriocheiris TaxID=2897391 RepID=A0A9X1MY34_9GAMM|nr:YniB family protein [Limnobaculum eriocheiris]MCD1126745.1 YniB family protein [Limnobaculum eriocheiris]